ncbi:chorismate-binding protein, partial [Erysipelatoclostridium ramosum]|uniref:chorismate-binding protein n=1 Tax=Thomasclavelia ramosa TaxID=1547 RepID=UPI001D06C769
IMTMPIAGTRPRGANEQEDHKAAQSLLEDPKENAEHNMLVDLGRNDIVIMERPRPFSSSSGEAPAMTYS